MVKVTGDKKFLSRLRRISGQEMDTAMTRAMLQGAELIRDEAKALVDEGGIPSPNHIVSVPGYPPNTDSGYLSGSIKAEHAGDLKAAVIVDAEYGTFLEFGTSNMFERPFLRPATANKRQAVITLAKAGVDRIIGAR